MAVHAKAPVYRIYLLTAWQTQNQPQTDEAKWRFHLTDPRTGKRYGFTTPTALITILQQLANEEQPSE